MIIRGVLRDGLRVAAQFTELPWVREQFQRKLGLDIYPGTVNVQVQDPAGLAALARLRAAGSVPDAALGGVPIDPPSSPASDPASSPPSGGGQGGSYCVGWCFPARIGGLPAAVVVPHVADYPPDKLELIAPVRVRDVLGLAPGDPVVVEVGPLPPPLHGAGRGG